MSSQPVPRSSAASKQVGASNPAAERLKLRAFKAAAFVPEPLWQAAARPIATWMVRRKPKPVRQWQLNFAIVMGHEPSHAQTKAAMASWFSNTVISLGLHRWTVNKVANRVEIDPDDVKLLHHLHASQGLVLALPHMGSWDLAGTWASLHGLPVVSVGENLPAGQFEYFAAMRKRLGYRVLRQYEPNIIDKLVDAVNHGRVIALVADRDYSRKGVSVNWATATGSIAMTLPAGPGLVAQRSGAALVPISLHFVGDVMHIELGRVIQPEPEADGLARMMQAQADYFSSQVCEHVIDWHMLQRFFPGVEA